MKNNRETFKNCRRKRVQVQSTFIVSQFQCDIHVYLLRCIVEKIYINKFTYQYVFFFFLITSNNLMDVKHKKCRKKQQEKNQNKTRLQSFFFLFCVSYKFVSRRKKFLRKNKNQIIRKQINNEH